MFFIQLYITPVLITAGEKEKGEREKGMWGERKNKIEKKEGKKKRRRWRRIITN